jgi:hypothetical protein
MPISLSCGALSGEIDCSSIGIGVCAKAGKTGVGVNVGVLVGVRVNVGLLVGMRVEVGVAISDGLIDWFGPQAFIVIPTRTISVIAGKRFIIIAPRIIQVGLTIVYKVDFHDNSMCIIVFSKIAFLKNAEFDHKSRGYNSMPTFYTIQENSIKDKCTSNKNVPRQGSSSSLPLIPS